MHSNEKSHGEAEAAVDVAPEEQPAESASAAPRSDVSASDVEVEDAGIAAAQPPADTQAEETEPEASSHSLPEAEAVEVEATTADIADAAQAAEVEAIAEEITAVQAETAAEDTTDVAQVEGVAEDTVPAAQAEVAEPTTMTEWLEQVDRVEEEAAIRRGDILEGVIVQTSPTEILIDIGAKAEGIVSGRELERMDRKSLEALQPGHTVLVYVLNPEGRNGNPVLSLARAQEEQDWREAENYAKSEEVYQGKVAGYNKGGLIVRFGKVRGFVPASQIGVERRRRASGASPEERYGDMIGEDILVKVVEVDRARNRLILSERAAAREWRSRQKERLLDELTVGETRTGRVISMTDFGVFVDLGGADGLVHLSELTWKPIEHPKEIVKVGERVSVKIISVDRERRRIGLSMKQLEEDPWATLARTHQVGQLVQGTITKLTKFGAFARLVSSEEIEGLIHISEFADTRVAHPRDVVAVGDVLTLRIVKMDTRQRRLGLSIKEVDSARYADLDWQFQQAMTFGGTDDDAADDVDDVEDEGDAPSAGGTEGYDLEAAGRDESGDFDDAESAGAGDTEDDED